MDTKFLITNIVAIIIAPIVAVIIAQVMQNRGIKRKDKLDIFRTLIVFNAYGWGSDFRPVDALNSIPVIFADDKKVTDVYTQYITACKSGRTEDIKTLIIKLLETMSASLGYNNRWEVFQNPYLPIGLQEEMLNEKKYKDTQLKMVDLFSGNSIQPQLQLPIEEEKEQNNRKTKNANTK